MNGETDIQEIINGCKQRDKKFQEQLYRLYSRTLFKICITYSQDKDEAADFLHDSFMLIFNKIDTFEFKGSFEGWIKRVTINLCLQELRKKKRMPEFNTDFSDYSSPVENREDEPEQVIPFPKLLEEINNLPQKSSLILKLYALEGWTHAEIAEELHISVGTSKSQLNYARNILKARLS